MSRSTTAAWSRGRSSTQADGPSRMPPSSCSSATSSCTTSASARAPTRGPLPLRRQRQPFAAARGGGRGPRSYRAPRGAIVVSGAEREACRAPAARRKAAMSNVASLLGLPSQARIAILHVDDVGMCHGANAAFLELYRKGAVDSGSVMVPCPWFPEIAAAARNDPSLDLGVHLTLTSEWEGYRWRAISTASRSSGLLDDDGYLPRRCRPLRAQLVPEAAEVEMRAQIDRALAAGIDATHIDTHMGAALVPELLAIYLRLGREYKLPVLLPRDLASYLDRLDLGPVDPAALFERGRRARESRRPNCRPLPHDARRAERRGAGRLPQSARYPPPRPRLRGPSLQCSGRHRGDRAAACALAYRRASPLCQRRAATLGGRDGHRPRWL